MQKTSFWGRLFGPGGERGRLRVGVMAALIATLVVFNVVVYGLSNRYTWYFYEEESYSHTISHATDQYLESLESLGQVKILFCDSPDALEADKVYNLVWQTANQFAERYDFITVENVNIYTHPEKVERYKYLWDEETNDYAKDPETGDRIKAADINTSSVIFAGSHDHIVLGMSNFFVLDENSIITAYNGEEITASMIRWTLTENHPVAYFTASHGESYTSAFYNRLICAGYQVKAIDLLTEELDEAGILVISNPQYDFVEGNPEKNIRAELEKMDEFLEKGGTVYAMMDPLVTNTVRLDAFFRKWGIQREKMTVKDPDQSVTQDGYSLICQYENEGLGMELAQEMDKINAGRVVIGQASPLTLTPVEGKTVSSILKASGGASGHHNGEIADTRGNYSLAAVSQDKNGGSVFVVGSANFTAIDAMTTNEYGNRDLIFLLFQRLSGADVPTGCTFLMFSPTTLENLTMGEARLWTCLVAVLVPVAVCAVGVFTVVRRRAR